MLKISNHLANTGLVLVRKQLSDGSMAALILLRNPVRCYSEPFYKQKCPPPKPPKKSKFLITALGATVLAGSAIVYAKHSPDTRNWLESNAPWADSIIAVVYQENQTYYEFASKNLYRIYSAIADFMFGKEGVPPMEFKGRSEQNLEKDAIEGFAPKDYSIPQSVLKPLLVEEKEKIGTPEIEMEATLVQTEECEPQKPPEYNVSKDTIELEESMATNAKIAIDAYKKCLKFAKEYNRLLYLVVETPYEYLDKLTFDALKSNRIERDKLLEEAQPAYAKASCAIETLDRMIQQNQVKAPPENLTVTKRYIRTFRDDLTAAEKAVKMELDQSNIADKFWNKVEAARKAYKDELEALFPGVQLCANKLDVRGQIDLLLCYTLKQVQFLQNELAQLQTIAEQKIARAVECNDAKLIIEAKAEDMLRKERIKMETDYQKRMLKIESEFQKKYNEQLLKQAETLENITRARIEKKEKEVMGRMSRLVSEEVEKERVKFKKELAAMAGKLQAIEQTLKKRATVETESRRSQSMWAAAEGLLAATRRPVPHTKVDSEIKALQRAGEKDTLVTTILKGIPKEAIDEGIATENALKDRFDQVERMALKVALIGSEGASLPMYFLSWLQSKLLFQKLAEIPRDELENKPTDFTKLDTFDIIQRARYYIDRNNLAAALRYINLLQGAARAAAKCWADDARRHLEIKQAAEAVMAHASLAGIQ